MAGAAPPTPPKADKVASSSEVNSATIGTSGNGAAAPPPSNSRSDSSGEFLPNFFTDEGNKILLGNEVEIKVNIA